MRTNTIKKGLLAACVALCASSCVDDQANGLTIRDVIYPEAPDCKITPDAKLVSTSGVLDLVSPLSSNTSVSLSDFIPSYYLPIRMQNNLLKEGDLQQLRINDDDMEYQVDTFRINVIGYNVCLSLPQADDPYRHCGDIPEALSYFVPSSAYVNQEVNSVDAVELFNGKQLMEFFGDFSSIDQYGTTVIAHVVALGRLENGKTIESNEFLFPVKICAGCRHVTCGTGYHLSFDNICFTYQDTPPTCEETK